VSGTAAAKLNSGEKSACVMRAFVEPTAWGGDAGFVVLVAKSFALVSRFLVEFQPTGNDGG
jgi:hypothetical protein